MPVVCESVVFDIDITGGCLVVVSQLAVPVLCEYFFVWNRYNKMFRSSSTARCMSIFCCV